MNLNDLPAGTPIDCNKNGNAVRNRGKNETNKS